MITAVIIPTAFTIMVIQCGECYLQPSPNCRTDRGRMVASPLVHDHQIMGDDPPVIFAFAEVNLFL